MEIQSHGRLKAKWKLYESMYLFFDYMNETHFEFIKLSFLQDRHTSFEWSLDSTKVQDLLSHRATKNQSHGRLKVNWNDWRLIENFMSRCIRLRTTWPELSLNLIYSIFFQNKHTSVKRSLESTTIENQSHGRIKAEWKLHKGMYQFENNLTNTQCEMIESGPLHDKHTSVEWSLDSVKVQDLLSNRAVYKFSRTDE